MYEKIWQKITHQNCRKSLFFKIVSWQLETSIRHAGAVNNCILAVAIRCEYVIRIWKMFSTLNSHHTAILEIFTNVKFYLKKRACFVIGGTSDFSYFNDFLKWRKWSLRRNSSELMLVVCSFICHMMLVRNLIHNELLSYKNGKWKIAKAHILAQK